MGSFYFMLDLIATFTIVLDFLPLVTLQSGGGIGNEAGALRAAKSARVGTRITRLMRVVRVLRVIKLFVSAQKKKNQTAEEDESEIDYAPSELGKALQARIARKTIVFVLTLLMGPVILNMLRLGQQRLG